MILRRIWHRALCAVGRHRWVMATQMRIVDGAWLGRYVWECPWCKRTRPR